MRAAVVVLSCPFLFATTCEAGFHHYNRFLISEHPTVEQDPLFIPIGADGLEVQRNRVENLVENTGPLSSLYTGTGQFDTGQANRYTFRGTGNSDYTHLRGAVELGFDRYQFYNYSPGLFYNSDGYLCFLDADGNVAFGGPGAVVQYELAAFQELVKEQIYVGGFSGNYTLDLVFALDGSHQNDFQDFGAPNWYVGNTNYMSLLGRPFTDLEHSYDGYAWADENGAIGGVATLSIELPAETWADYDLTLAGFVQLTYYQVFAPPISLQFFRGSLDGVVNFNMANTATLESVIITVPQGTNPSSVVYQFGSGTAYNVEIRTAVASVPEPNTIALLLGALAAAPWWLRRTRG